MRRYVVIALLIPATVALVAWAIVRDDIADLRNRAAASAAEPVNSQLGRTIVALELDGDCRAALFPKPLSPLDSRVRARWQPDSFATIKRHLLLLTARLIFRERDFCAIDLHSLYFGVVDKRAVYGIVQASDAYFHKPVSALSIDEVATLTGMVRSPNVYSPLRHPDLARQRRDFILSKAGVSPDHRF